MSARCLRVPKNINNTKGSNGGPQSSLSGAFLHVYQPIGPLIPFQSVRNRRRNHLVTDAKAIASRLSSLLCILTLISEALRQARRNNQMSGSKTNFLWNIYYNVHHHSGMCIYVPCRKACGSLVLTVGSPIAGSIGISCSFFLWLDSRGYNLDVS